MRRNIQIAHINFFRPFFCAAIRPDSSLNATLTYDSSSGCGTAYRGRLCTVADATGTTTYVYDVLGRVTSVSENRGGGLTLATSYTYDLAGNISGITLPSGRTVTYTRNANGMVSGVSATVNGSSTTLASSVTYLPFGPMTALTYGNSLTLSATFDQDYYPTNRTISGGIANWTYDTDDNGNVTQAGTTTYGYDALNRIKAENAGAATSYTYDATSNRLTKVQGSTTTTTVPAANNKISAVGGTSYTYDAAGNITAIGTNGYVWSNQGLMKEYKISGVSTATYTYNAYNQRTKKVTAGVTTHYVYGTDGLLYGEYTSAGALVREYVYLNDEPLAQVNSGSPETVIYLHVDHLGTPRFATNTGGSQVWAWVNDAFGASTPSGSATVNLRMPGQYYDSENGLFYNWNRYYNQAIGRYISSDPIGLDGGDLNTFNYAAVNPVRYIDPAGDFFFIPLLIEVGEGIAVYCRINPKRCAQIAMNMGTSIYDIWQDWHSPEQDGCPNVLNSEEHTKNARPSTAGKHQKGQARKKKDYGQEKGDDRRRPPRNPPPGWEGPWPPKKG